MKKNQSKVLVGLIASAALFFSGCGNSENFVFTNTNTNINVPVAAPVAVNDSINALGNATLNQAAANGVLANDTLNGGEIIAFDAVGSQNGAINLNADGSFTYTPVFGFVGAETFTYTLANAGGESTATVTLTSTGRGFFVNNTVPDGGDGSQADPFDTLAEAVAAAASGDTIYVFRGDGTNTGQAGAINLPLGVNLIGEGTGLILGQTIEPQGQAPVLQGPVNCGGNNTISGIALENSATDSIAISGVGDVTVDNVSSDLAANTHIDIDDATGTITINNCVFTDVGMNASSDYIDIDQTSVSANFVITGNSFTNPMGNDAQNAVEFDSDGTTSDFTMTFSNNTVAGLDATDEFAGALEVDADQSDGSFTLTADNNDISFIGAESIEVDSSDDDVALAGSVTNNMIMEVANDDAIELDGNNGTFIVSGNIIDNISERGINLNSNALGATFILENNQISDVGFEGIRMGSGGTGNTVVAIRNNTITNAILGSIRVEQGNTADLCAVVTGNEVNNDMIFDNQTTGSYEVEQFGNMGDLLATLNTLDMASIMVPNTAVTSVAAGTCGI